MEPGQSAPPNAPVAWPQQAPPKPGGFDLTEFITFRYLITPTVITVVYVIGAVLITLGSLAAMASGGGNGFITGLIVLIFGNLYWRVILEFVIVLFRMNGALQSIDRRGRRM